jgi:hypothetical protein
VLVTNVEADNTGTSLPTIINGDMLILNKAFANLTGTPTISSAVNNDVIYIAQGIAAGKAVLSLPISLKNVTSVKRGAYSAPAEQVTHIGYVGSGSATLKAPLNNTEYTMIVQYKTDQRITPNKESRDVYSYVTDSAATYADIASAFVRKINNNRYSKVSAVVLSSNAGSAITGTGTITATNGSKVITAGTDIDALMAVGDWIRIASTATTGAVYKIVSMDTTAQTATLDSPFEGTTISASAEGNHEYISAADFEAANVGIQLTAEAIAYNGIDLYTKVSFDVSMYAEDEDVETITFTTAKAEGQGYWQQVRDLEYFAQGYLGVSNRTLFPTANLGSGTPATRAVVDNTYNLLVIEHFDEHPGDLQGQYKAPMTTIIAFYASSAPTKSTKETTIIDILESLFESAGVFVE